MGCCGPLRVALHRGVKVNIVGRGLSFVFLGWDMENQAIFRGTVWKLLDLLSFLFLSFVCSKSKSRLCKLVFRIPPVLSHLILHLEENDLDMIIVQYLEFSANFRYLSILRDSGGVGWGYRYNFLTLILQTPRGRRNQFLTRLWV